jgi:hypothetical protein
MAPRDFVTAVAAAQQDLTTVLDAMREHLDAAITNSTCSLRVHIGSVRADGCPGFVLATLHAFATLVPCCERALNQLHTDKRQHGNGLLQAAVAHARPWQRCGASRFSCGARRAFPDLALAVKRRRSYPLRQPAAAATPKSSSPPPSPNQQASASPA